MRPTKPITEVLVANRGEIAVRVVRAGAPLVVVEALETENEMRSPEDRAVALRARDGRTVGGSERPCAVE